MDPEVVESLAQINKTIRKDNKSLRNRIQSIIVDNRFLEERVLPTFPKYPVIPNERCGLWYCKPSSFTQTSYFKSTDGHINQWDFSTRRLNFQLLPTIAKNGGIIIVDSTRRGKKIPDALSKTVPIWCAVLNMIMLESQDIDYDYKDILFVPPVTVPESERDRIIKKLPSLKKKLQILDLCNGDQLYKLFNGKLLRPLWVHPGSSLLQTAEDPFTGEICNGSAWQVPEDENILPIILCTVSYQAQDGVDKKHGYTYVQGAADDHELWSFGLTSDMLWHNIAKLSNLELDDNQLQELVEQIIDIKKQERNKKTGIDGIFSSIDEITPQIFLGAIPDNTDLTPELQNEIKNKYALTIILSDNSNLIKMEETVEDLASIKVYKLQSGSKKSSKDLRKEIAGIVKSVDEHLYNSKDSRPILICCNTGTDMSVAIILCCLCKNYSLDWELGKPEEVITKVVIRKHLTRMISHLEGRNINPSRATLNSVNSYLM